MNWRNLERIVAAMGVAIPIAVLMWIAIETRLPELALPLSVLGFVGWFAKMLRGEDK